MDHSNVPPTSTSDNAEEARAPGPPFHTALQPSQVPMYIPNPVPYPFTAASAQSYSGLASVPPVFSPSLPSYFRYDDPVLQRNVGPVSQPIAGPISQHTMSQLIAGPMSRPIATPMSQPIATPMLQPIAGARPLSAGPYNPHGHPVPYPPRQVSSLAQDPVQITSRPHPQEVANPNLIPFQGYRLQPSPSRAKPVSRPGADSFHSSPAPAQQISSRSFNPLGSYRPSSPSDVPYSVQQVASPALKSSSLPVRRQQEPPNVIQEMLDKVNREPQSQTFTIWSGHLTDVSIFFSVERIQCTVTTSQREINSEMKPELWPAEMLLDCYFIDFEGQVWTVNLDVMGNPQSVDTLRLIMGNEGKKLVGIVKPYQAIPSCPLRAFLLIWNEKQKQFVGLIPIQQETFARAIKGQLDDMEHLPQQWQQQQQQLLLQRAAASSSARQMQTVPSEQHLEATQEVVELMIPANKIGLIIGKGGKMIKSLQERAGCKMKIIQDRQYANAPEKPLRMTGLPESCKKGRELVLQLIEQNKLKARGLAGGDFQESIRHIRQTVEVRVPKSIVDFVIGHNGEHISEIQKTCGVRLQFQNDIPGTDYRIATITGPSDACMRAKKMVEETVAEQQTPQLKQQQQQQQHKAQLERLLTHLETASHEQQQELFARIQANPEQQQQLLASVQARRLRKQQEQRQQQELRKRQARRLLDEALERGYVLCHIDKCITMGNAGAGKTHVACRLFNKDPPVVRCSTPLAEAPIRAISRIIIGAVKTKTDWFQVSREKLMEMLAHAVKAGVPMEEQAEGRVFVGEGIPTDAAATLQSPQSSQDTTCKQIEDKDAGSENEPQKDSHTEESSQPIPGDERVRTSASPEIVSHPVMKHISPSSEEILEMIESSTGSKLFLEIRWIHFIDTGGQPHFHELFSSFIKNATATLFVIKLSEGLDQIPMIEYYENGQLCGGSCPSALSNNQIFQHCVQTVQSQMALSSTGKQSKFIVVGTHRDLEHTCSETRAEKNRKLLEILRPIFHDGLIFYGNSTKEVIFPMNAKEPEAEDREVAALIRRLVSDDGSDPAPFKIPIGWFLLEQDIRKYASLKGRGVVSKDECRAIAAKLKINDQSLEAALAYLHKLSIFLYFPDILPEVVFCESQVLLDKITELVAFSYQLRRQSATLDAFIGRWLLFRDEGIVTQKMLHEKRFSKHYVPGFFTPGHLFRLLESLLIIAPAKYYSDEEYFMPSLLPSITKGDVEKHRPAAMSSVAPLLIYFPDGCAPFGVFCALVVYLLSICTWRISYQSGCPSCVARNCIEFQLPIPGSATLIDSFTHFELHLSIPEVLCSSFCPETRQSMLAGLEKASETRQSMLTSLEKASESPQCEDSQFEVAFFCHCKEPAHPGTYTCKDGHKFLMCQKYTGKYCKLERHHTVWLEDTITPVEGGIASQDLVGALLQSEAELDKSNMSEIGKYLLKLDKAHLLNLGLVLGLDYQKLRDLQDSPTFRNDLALGWILKQDYVIEKGLLPTWRNLVVALRDEQVGQTGLANDIARDKGIE